MAECSICGLLWDTRGFASHKRSCRRKLEEKKRDAEVLRDIEALKLAKQSKFFLSQSDAYLLGLFNRKKRERAAGKTQLASNSFNG